MTLSLAAGVRGRTAIVGVGETSYYKRGQAPASAFELAVEAVTRAATDAGLPLESIDGMASYSNDGTDPIRLARALGLRELKFSNMFWGGGGGGVCGAIGNAAAAVLAGYADHVVVLRSLVQGTVRFGSAFQAMPSEARLSGDMAYSVPFGVMSPAQTIALRTRRFMHDYGIGQEVLAAIALTSYAHAQHNPRAVMYGRPLTLEEYSQSRWIVEPFHLFDCCQENDGAAAVIVARSEEARHLRQVPAIILAAAQGSSSGHDLFTHGGEDYATANFKGVAARLYDMAGIGPGDVDVVQVYENFTGGALMSIVEHQLCSIDDAATVLTPQNLLWTGGLPLNTSGGNLAECYMHGLELVIEATRQLRGTSTCQVPEAEISLVAGGPVAAPVSSLVLGR
jgi:acetyl-CoA acetyltransferase